MEKIGITLEEAKDGRRATIHHLTLRGLWTSTFTSSYRIAKTSRVGEGRERVALQPLIKVAMLFRAPLPSALACVHHPRSGINKVACMECMGERDATPEVATATVAHKYRGRDRILPHFGAQTSQQPFLLPIYLTIRLPLFESEKDVPKAEAAKDDGSKREEKEEAVS